MATRTPAAARSWAKAKVGTKGYGGLCLQFTRLAFNVAAKHASARAAWNAAKHKHRTSSTANIPVGAPIYMDRASSKYGHVAIYDGNGYMITTRASTNRISRDKVSTWTGSYGYKLLGWSEDLNGVRVVPKKTTSTASTRTFKVTAKIGVNVRAKPSTSAKIVNKLPHGATFPVARGSGTVTGSGLRWVKSTRGNYVAYKYIKAVN